MNVTVNSMNDKLDYIEVCILKAVKLNPFCSFANLAKPLGVSRHIINGKAKKLRQSGYVESLRAGRVKYLNVKANEVLDDYF